MKDELGMLNFFAEVGLSDTEKGLAMIELMVKTEKLDRDLWENHRVIACPAFLESITDAYERRLNQIITIEEIRARFQNPSSGVSVSETTTETPQSGVFDDNNPQTKLKESKVKESGGGNNPPKTETKTETEEPPPLFLDIKNKITTEGFFLDDKDVDLLISKTDPTWFGENSFIEFIAEVARGRPGYAEKTRDQRRGLFRFLLLEAPERRDEFPHWRAEREKKAQSEVRAKTREEAYRKAREPPSVCPRCGGSMAPWEGKDDLSKCLSCGGWYLFFEESQEWDFQGPD